MDNGLVLSEFIREIGRSQVLILVVVDNGLVPAIAVLFLSSTGLNPYCSGQWSRTNEIGKKGYLAERLNPYCSGRWSRT